MSIKSEKAKAAIKDVIPMYIAEKAVELAESDARKRAVRAFCVMCRDEGGCPDIHHMTGQEMLNCNYVNDFLKHYDNE